MKNKAGVFALLLKIGPKVLSVLAKSSKFILVGVSFAAYSYVYTWQFSFIILSMLVVHEYGHIWAMQRCGLKMKGIYLIPFVGGLAVSDGMAKTRWDEVFIAMMGPVFGLVLSLMSMIAYYITAAPLFAAAASWMAMVNIINLFPVTPLDGGRVMKAVTLSLNNRLGIIYMSAALLALLAAVVLLGLWTFVVLVIIGGIELYFEFKKISNQKELAELLKWREALKSRISDDLNRKIDKLVEEHNDDTVKMNWKFNVVSMLFYFVILTLLYAVMHLMSAEPGAAMALQMLK